MPLKILQPSFVVVKNHFFGIHRRRGAWRRDLMLLGFVLSTMALIFFGMIMVLGSMRGDVFFQAIIPVKVIQLTFYTFFILMLISNTVAAAGNIYAAHNMELLLQAPVSPIRLYLAKLFATTIETGSMYFVFMVPLGLAYHYSLGVSYAFLLIAMLISVPFLFITASIGVIVATFFTGFAAVVWRRGLFLLIAAGAIGLWLYLKLHSLLSNIRFEHGGTNAVVQLISLFDNPNPLWLPSSWASDLLTPFVDPQMPITWAPVLLLFGTAFGTAALGFLIFDLLMLPTRSRVAGQHKVSEEGSRATASKASDIVRWLIERVYHALPINRHTRALIIKDLTCLVRDRAQSLQLILYLGIAAFYVVIFTFMSAAINLFPTALQLWWAFLGWVNIVLSGFIINAVITRLVYPAISLEGKALWILLVSPMDTGRLVRAKVSCWLPLIAFIAITLLFSGSLAIGLNLAASIYTLLVGLALSIGGTGLATGLGAVFAKFEWESPNQISAGIGTLVLLPLGLALVGLTAIPAAALLLITQVDKVREILGPNWSTGILFGSLVAVYAINWGAMTLACRRGAAALSKQTLQGR